MTADDSAPIDPETREAFRRTWLGQAPERPVPTGPSYEERERAFRLEYWQARPNDSREDADAAWAVRQREDFENHPATIAWKARTKAREAAAAAEQRRQVEAHEEQLQEAGRARLERDKAVLREHFLANGGSPSEFEHAWPRLRAGLIEKRTLEGRQQTQADMAADVRRLWSR